MWNRSGEGPVHLSSRLEAMASSRVAKTKLSSSLGPSTRHGHGKVRNARVQATERSWGREVRPYLAERAPKQVLVEEAMKMARQDGAVLLDVRLEKDFEQVHAEGAVNVPLFRPIEGTGEFPRFERKRSRSIQKLMSKCFTSGMSSLLKRVIYAVNGVKGSEGNPNFLSSVEKSIQRGQTVLVMCDAGGAYLPTPSFMEGKKSR